MDDQSRREPSDGTREGPPAPSGDRGIAAGPHTSRRHGGGAGVVSRPLADPPVALVASRFRALGHPVRLGLIDLLDRLGEANVQALADELAAPHQNTSKHLRTLFRAGILTRRQEGRIAVYSVIDRETFAIIERVAAGVVDAPPREAEPTSRSRRAVSPQPAALG